MAMEHGKRPRSPGSFTDMYLCGEPIGEGCYAEVVRATCRASGKERAAKKLSRRREGNTPEGLKMEAQMLEMILTKPHPYIIELCDVFDDKDEMILVTEMCDGGNLLDHLEAREVLSEEQAGRVTGQLLEALQVTHSLGIIHRDVKLDNVLLTKPAEDLNTKLADFGSAIFESRASSGDAMVVGTMEYASPEALSADYCFGSDMWAVGVCVFILLSGCIPFDSQLATRQVRYEFDDEEWVAISNDAKDFITKLFVKDPKGRLTASQALEHPWIQTHFTPVPIVEVPDEEANEKDVMTTVEEALSPDLPVGVEDLPAHLDIPGGSAKEGKVEEEEETEEQEEREKRVSCESVCEVVLETLLGSVALLEVLHESAGVTVYSALLQSSGEPLAVKRLTKTVCNPQETLDQEFQILTRVTQLLPECPQLPKLFAKTEDPYTFNLVMDLAPGSSLRNFMDLNQVFSETEVFPLISQLLLGVQALHSIDVVHRQLCLDNLLVDDNQKLTIMDFSSSIIQFAGAELRELLMLEHQEYASPELLSCMSSKACDLWAVGVILFTLLNGAFPFQDELATRRARLAWRRSLSEEVKDLIQGLLTVDAAARLTADQALHHRFFSQLPSSCTATAPSSATGLAEIKQEYEQQISNLLELRQRITEDDSSDEDLEELLDQVLAEDGELEVDAPLLQSQDHFDDIMRQEQTQEEVMEEKKEDEHAVWTIMLEKEEEEENEEKKDTYSKAGQADSFNKMLSALDDDEDEDEEREEVRRGSRVVEALEEVMTMASGMMEAAAATAELDFTDPSCSSATTSPAPPDLSLRAVDENNENHPEVPTSTKMYKELDTSSEEEEEQEEEEKDEDEGAERESKDRLKAAVCAANLLLDKEEEEASWGKTAGSSQDAGECNKSTELEIETHRVSKLAMPAVPPTPGEAGPSKLALSLPPIRTPRVGDQRGNAGRKFSTDDLARLFEKFDDDSVISSRESDSSLGSGGNVQKDVRKLSTSMALSDASCESESNLELVARSTSVNIPLLSEIGGKPEEDEDDGEAGSSSYHHMAVSPNMASLYYFTESRRMKNEPTSPRKKDRDSRMKSNHIAFRERKSRLARRSCTGNLGMVDENRHADNFPADNDHTSSRGDGFEGGFVRQPRSSMTGRIPSGNGQSSTPPPFVTPDPPPGPVPTPPSVTHPYNRALSSPTDDSSDHIKSRGDGFEGGFVRQPRSSEPGYGRQSYSSVRLPRNSQGWGPSEGSSSSTTPPYISPPLPPPQLFPEPSSGLVPKGHARLHAVHFAEVEGTDSRPSSPEPEWGRNNAEDDICSLKELAPELLAPEFWKQGKEKPVRKLFPNTSYADSVRVLRKLAAGAFTHELFASLFWEHCRQEALEEVFVETSEPLPEDQPEGLVSSAPFMKKFSLKSAEIEVDLLAELFWDQTKRDALKELARENQPKFSLYPVKETLGNAVPKAFSRELGVGADLAAILFFEESKQAAMAELILSTPTQERPQSHQPKSLQQAAFQAFTHDSGLAPELLASLFWDQAKQGAYAEILPRMTLGGGPTPKTVRSLRQAATGAFAEKDGLALELLAPVFWEQTKQAAFEELVPRADKALDLRRAASDALVCKSDVSLEVLATLLWAQTKNEAYDHLGIALPIAPADFASREEGIFCYRQAASFDLTSHQSGVSEELLANLFWELTKQAAIDEIVPPSKKSAAGPSKVMDLRECSSSAFSNQSHLVPELLASLFWEQMKQEAFSEIKGGGVKRVEGLREAVAKAFTQESEVAPELLASLYWQQTKEAALAELCPQAKAFSSAWAPARPTPIQEKLALELSANLFWEEMQTAALDEFRLNEGRISFQERCVRAVGSHPEWESSLDPELLGSLYWEHLKAESGEEILSTRIYQNVEAFPVRSKLSLYDKASLVYPEVYAEHVWEATKVAARQEVLVMETKKEATARRLSESVHWPVLFSAQLKAAPQIRRAPQPARVSGTNDSSFFERGFLNHHLYASAFWEEVKTSAIDTIIQETQPGVSTLLRCKIKDTVPGSSFSFNLSPHGGVPETPPSPAVIGLRFNKRNPFGRDDGFSPKTSLHKSITSGQKDADTPDLWNRSTHMHAHKMYPDGPRSKSSPLVEESYFDESADLRRKAGSVDIPSRIIVTGSDRERAVTLSVNDLHTCVEWSELAISMPKPEFTTIKRTWDNSRKGSLVSPTKSPTDTLSVELSLKRNDILKRMFRHIPSLADSEQSSSEGQFEFPSDLPPAVLNRRGSFPFTTATNSELKVRRGSKTALHNRFDAASDRKPRRQTTNFDFGCSESTKTALATFAEMKEASLTLNELLPDKPISAVPIRPDLSDSSRLPPRPPSNQQLDRLDPTGKPASRTLTEKEVLDVSTAVSTDAFNKAVSINRTTFAFLTPTTSGELSLPPPGTKKPRRKSPKTGNSQLPADPRNPPRHHSVDDPTAPSSSATRRKELRKIKGRRKSPDEGSMTLSKGAVLKERELARIRQGRKELERANSPLMDTITRSLSVPNLEVVCRKAREEVASDKLKIKEKEKERRVTGGERHYEHLSIGRPNSPNCQRAKSRLSHDSRAAEEEEDEDEDEEMDILLTNLMPGRGGNLVELSAHSDITSLSRLRNDFLAQQGIKTRSKNLDFIRDQGDSAPSTPSSSSAHQTMPASAFFDVALEFEKNYNRSKPNSNRGSPSFKQGDSPEWRPAERKKSKDYSVVMLKMLFMKTVERYAEKWIHAAVMEAADDVDNDAMLNEF